MNSKTLFTLLIGAAALTPGWRLSAQSATPAAIDSLLAEAQRLDVFSGNVLIWQNDQPWLERSVGWSIIELHLLNNYSRRFQIGSITKWFTKVMVLQLAEEGRLGLDDAVGKYIPGFAPEIGQQVTLRQLMNHTSGFGQYYDVPGWEDWNDRVASNAEIVAFIAAHERLQFPPGSEAAYSNSGYILLGGVVEKVTGLPYEQALRERIFVPAGLTDAGYDVRVRPQSNVSVGYLSNRPGPMQSNVEEQLVGAADGGIYCTAADLMHFERALFFDKKLLHNDASLLQLVTTAQNTGQYADWAEFSRRGKFLIAGGDPGLNAVWGHDFAKKRTVIVLSNYAPPSAEELYQRIARLLDGQPAEPLQLPAPRYLYRVIKTKGGDYFEKNYRAELANAGLESDDDMPLFETGQALTAEGDWKNARSLYRAYTQAFPRIVVAWVQLGDANRMLGDKETARQCYEHALELRPGAPGAKAGLEKLKN